jgi:hypothetical protein
MWQAKSSAQTKTRNSPKPMLKPLSERMAMPMTASVTASHCNLVTTSLKNPAAISGTKIA